MADSLFSKLNPFRGWNPSLWAGYLPNGIGQVKPNHYAEMLSIAWKNRDQLPFAWRILSRGVCDGCALGTSGLRDYTMKGVHLCMVRLHLLRLNTAPAIPDTVWTDVDALRRRSSRELRDLGRLAYPMVRRRGERGFTRISWDGALDLITERVARVDPDRLAFYLTSRGITNEVYYVAQRVARYLGTNNVDNSARLCHAPSTVALKETVGIGATSCSYTDWIGSDLIVFFGSDTPNNQPVTTKYLYYAKQAGTRVAVVNPYREPGLERYWVPSVLESALFGTKLADHFFGVNTGGDAAFLSGVLKVLIERDALDHELIERRTVGFDELRGQLEETPWADLERASGTTREKMTELAELLIGARNAVFVWSMGLTQHPHGVDNVRALVHLALARGYVGREKNGLMPIRGHSGVQGGAEVGCVPGELPGGTKVGSPEAARFERLWGFAPPSAPGLSAGAMLERAHAGGLELLYSVGGNFLETLPDPDRIRASLERVPLRVHQDIVLTSQMLVDPADTVLVLPARTRYEQAGGGTETSTERRILFSPEVPGRRVGESRSEWEILQSIAERVQRPGGSWQSFESGAAIRREIAEAVPSYAGIEKLEKAGDQFQYGGPRLYADGVFATPDGKAHFRPVAWPDPRNGDGFLLSTRRGKQFNTMVHGEVDPLTGAARDAVFLCPPDLRRLGIAEGETVRVRSEHGTMRGRAFAAELQPGNCQVHWPEGNVLLGPDAGEPRSGIPNYNAVVRIERDAARETSAPPA